MLALQDLLEMVFSQRPSTFARKAWSGRVFRWI